MLQRGIRFGQLAPTLPAIQALAAPVDGLAVTLRATKRGVRVEGLQAQVSLAESEVKRRLTALSRSLVAMPVPTGSPREAAHVVVSEQHTVGRGVVLAWAVPEELAMGLLWAWWAIGVFGRTSLGAD